jgi:hypothetical protein
MRTPGRARKTKEVFAMTIQASLTVVVASYVSRVDAKSDLEAIDGLYFSGAVGAYDAALVINGAWGNAQLGARTSRSSADFFDGPLHGTFTRLFGGPFVGGDAPAPLPDIDHRLPRATVVRFGDAFPAASVVLIMVALTHSDALAKALSHTEWVASEDVSWTEENTSRLADILHDVLRRGVQLTEKQAATVGQ